MAFPEIQPFPMAATILSDPGGYFDSPMDVIRDPRLCHDDRFAALSKWLAHERLLYRADRDPGRVTIMCHIEAAIRTLEAMDQGDGQDSRRDEPHTETWGETRR